MQFKNQIVQQNRFLDVLLEAMQAVDCRWRAAKKCALGKTLVIYVIISKLIPPTSITLHPDRVKHQGGAPLIRKENWEVLKRESQWVLDTAEWVPRCGHLFPLREF